VLLYVGNATIPNVPQILEKGEGVMNNVIENLHELHQFNEGVKLNDASYLDLMNTLSYTINDDPQIDKKTKSKLTLSIVKMQQVLEPYSA